jgi:hypothetical protein
VAIAELCIGLKLLAEIDIRRAGACMHNPTDQEAFRDRAYQLAREQLAVVLTEYLGLTGGAARFDSLATQRAITARHTTCCRASSLRYYD